MSHRSPRTSHTTSTARPLIDVTDDGKTILHDGKPVRVVIGKRKICVGCTDISPAALHTLHALWLTTPVKSEEEPQVIQDAPHPC